MFGRPIARLVKLLVFFQFLIFSWGVFGLPLTAQAAPLCRTADTQQVCILKITRSAKYYWEYRAIVQVDDDRRPMGRYDCRTGEYLGRNGKRIAKDVGAKMICSFFKQGTEPTP